MSVSHLFKIGELLLNSLLNSWAASGRRLLLPAHILKQMSFFIQLSQWTSTNRRNPLLCKISLMKINMLRSFPHHSSTFSKITVHLLPRKNLRHIIQASSLTLNVSHRFQLSNFSARALYNFRSELWWIMSESVNRIERSGKKHEGKTNIWLLQRTTTRWGFPTLVLGVPPFP